MKKRAFLAPLAASTALLGTAAADAKTTQGVAPTEPSPAVKADQASVGAPGWVTLHRSPSGTLLAQHYSHASHASHASHTSHYSSR